MPRQNTSPADFPQPVRALIEQLAQQIVIARKRRGESQAQWAQKLGISQPTMTRLERGDPSVAMATYVMCIWLINPEATLTELIAPNNGQVGPTKPAVPIKAARSARPERQTRRSTVLAQTEPAAVAAMPSVLADFEKLLLTPFAPQLAPPLAPAPSAAGASAPAGKAQQRKLAQPKRQSASKSEVV